MRISNIFFLGLFALGVCTAKTNPYQIQIISASESKTFEMRVGETQKFSIITLEDEQRNTVFPNKLWWQFDKVLLKKVGGDNTSIILKAEKPCISKLSVSCVIDFLSYQDSITIIITP